MGSSLTLVDKFYERLKNDPIVSIFIIAGGIFSAVAGVIKSADEVYKIIGPVASRQTLFDLAGDFSERNPSGPWEYGYLPPRKAVFDPTEFKRFGLGAPSFNYFAGIKVRQLYSWTIAKKDVPEHSSDGLGVAKNVSDQDYTLETATVPAREISLHPGTDAWRTAVRWTAPRSGEYSISGSFTGADRHPTTTGVSVFLGNQPKYGANIAIYGRPQQFAFEANLSKGDELFFVVDDGDNGLFFDTTLLAAKIQRLGPRKNVFLNHWPIGLSAFLVGLIGLWLLNRRRGRRRRKQPTLVV